MQSSVAMQQYEFEQKDVNFTRPCFLCRSHVTEGTRTDFVKHLFRKHNFWLGPAENLVFMDELFDLLENYLNRLKCFYCGGEFTSRQTFIDHTRKKQHRRLNPKNNEFDKFFLKNNPLDFPEPKENVDIITTDSESSAATETASCDNDDNCSTDSHWADWKASQDFEITCLFCTQRNTDFQEVLKHMQFQHSFNYTKVTENFDFYSSVKLVNFIRKKIALNECPFCNSSISNDIDEINVHLKTNHSQLINVQQLLTDESLYCPTLENDAFLCYIEDCIP